MDGAIVGISWRCFRLFFSPYPGRDSTRSDWVEEKLNIAIETGNPLTERPLRALPDIMTPQIKPRSRRRTRAKSITETAPSTQQPDNSNSKMVTFYDEIVPELHDFITAQTVFFTGTAPLHLPNSHVNVSPKGYADSTFTIANSKCVWYQDATGSGVETIAHLYDNERITIMFCSFGPQPLIVRLFGKGKVYEVCNSGDCG